MTHLPLAELRAAFLPSLPQFRGAHYAAYGHSFGNVQTVKNAWPNSVYPARLRDLLGADSSQFFNQCQNGTTMAQINTYLRGTWVQGTYGLVTLMGFKNDMGTHTTISAFQQSLRDFLNFLLAGTPQPTILVIKDVYAQAAGWATYGTGATNADVDAYNAAAASVLAEATYASAPIVVADPQADGWDITTMISAGDGLHPNDHGMAHITASALKALARADYRDGLNYGYAAAAPSGPTTYAADTFTRTASTPGTTTTGSLAWAVRGTSGTPSWSTNGTQLVGSTPGGDSACVVDTGHADGTVQGTLVSQVAAGNAALSFRVVDGSNLWLLYAASGGYQLAKRVSGSYTFLSGTGPVPASGDVLKVVLAGNSITAYVNGTQVLTGSDAQFVTATAHGFWVTGSGGVFDTFTATS